MKKIVECYTSSIPIGSSIKENIFTESGALLIHEGTEVTDKLLRSIKHYSGKVRIEIEVDDAKHVNVDNAAKKESDQIFKISEHVKQRALKSMEMIYSGCGPEVIAESAIDVADSIMKSLDLSKSALISVDELKVCDEYTFKHCIDVGAMSMVIAKKLGESEDFLKDIALAGILHDLGKRDIPSEILNKPSKLDADEWDEMKKHPIYSYKIIEGVTDIPKRVKQAVLEHHESADGTGYPLGKKSENICKMAKIITVADVYDALVTDRPYKKAAAPADALEILMEMYNKFDVDILTAFVSCVVLYPVGSIIKLSNGEYCTVVKNNENFPLRPVCQNIRTGEIYDLLNNRELLNLVIQ